MINKLVDIVRTTLNTGLDKAITATLVVASLLACIDFVLAIIYEWSDNFTQALKIFWKKMLSYTFSFAIITNWKTIINGALNLAFNIGYIFFPPQWANKVKGEMPDFDGIYNLLRLNSLSFWKKGMALTGISNIGTRLMILIIVLVLMTCTFLIIKEIIIQTVKFYVAGCIGVFLLMLSTFEQTKSMSTKVYNTLLNSFMTLVVTLSLTGVALYCTEMAINTMQPTLEGSEINLGDMGYYMFTMMIIAYLVNCSKEFANGIMSGNVASSGGGSAIMGAIAKGVMTATAAAATIASGGIGIVGAVKSYKTAKSVGATTKGALKSAFKGAKAYVNAAKGTRLGKLGGALKGAVDNTAKFASGQIGIGQMASKLTKGTLGTVGGQIAHDSTKVNMAFDEALNDSSNNLNVKEFIENLSDDERKALEKEYEEASADSNIKKEYPNVKKYINSKKFDRAYQKFNNAKDIRRNKAAASEYAHNKAKITGMKDKNSINKFKQEYMNMQNGNNYSASNNTRNNTNYSNKNNTNENTTNNSENMNDEQFENENTNNYDESTKNESASNNNTDNNFNDTSNNASNDENYGYSASNNTRKNGFNMNDNSSSTFNSETNSNSSNNTYTNNAHSENNGSYNYFKYEKETFMRGLDANPLGTASAASQRLRDDDEFIHKAVLKQGICLQYASERLKDDANIVKTAIKNNPDSIQYASKRLQDDDGMRDLAETIRKINKRNKG